MRSRRWAGKFRLALLLTPLLCGCGTAPARSDYRVLVPTLEAPVQETPCDLRRTVNGVLQVDLKTCVVLVREDWQMVVRELKAACRVVGGTPEECGIPQ